MNKLIKLFYLVFLCAGLFGELRLMACDSLASQIDDSRISPLDTVKDCAWTVGAEKKPRRLAIYCDNFGCEGIASQKKDVIAYMLGQTLHQKACSVIVSKSIFRLFVFFKQPVNKNDSSFDRGRKKSGEDFVFDVGEWDIYSIKGGPFFLLQPKAIVKNDLVGRAKYKLPLFKKESLEKFRYNASLKEAEKLRLLGKFIKEERCGSGSLVDVLRDVFYSHDVVDEMFRQCDDLRNDYVEALAQGRCTGLLDFLYAPWNIFICGHGQVDSAIAGVGIRDFSRSLSFFNENLNTNVVLVSSCYVAGKNQRYMENNSLKYLLIIAGIQQAVTIGLVGNPENPDASMDIERFFDSLEKKGVRDVLAEAVRYCTVPKDWFRISLGINALPQVLAPGALCWKPLVDGFSKVEHLSDELLAENNLYCVRRKKAVLVSPSVIDNVMRVEPYQCKKTPEWISAWENFPVATCDDSFFPAFVSANTLTPFHFFKTIVVDGDEFHYGVLKFLRDSFLNIQERTQPIYWYIQKLVGFNDISSVLRAARQSRFAKIYGKKFATRHECLEAFSGQKAAGLEADLADCEAVELSDVVVSAYDVSRDEPAAYCSAVWSVLIMFAYNGQYYRMRNDNAFVTGDGNALWHFEAVDKKTYYDELLRLRLDDFVSKIQQLKAESDLAVGLDVSDLSLINSELEKMVLSGSEIEGIAS